MKVNFISMTFDDIVLTKEQQTLYSLIVEDKNLYQYQKNILKYLIANKDKHIYFHRYPRGVERKDIGAVYEIAKSNDDIIEQLKRDYPRT